jgi:hypothetical protein
MDIRGSFLGVERPGREADHSPPSIAELKECVELYLHSPNTPSRRGAQLMHRVIFTFRFNFHYFNAVYFKDPGEGRLLWMIFGQDNESSVIKRSTKTKG